MAIDAQRRDPLPVGDDGNRLHGWAILIYLNTSTRTLTAVLSANVATAQLDVVACFYDVPAKTKDDNSEYLGSVALTTTANSTAITVVSAPPTSVVRNVTELSVFNADTTTAVVSLKYADNGTTKTLIKNTLATLETLHFESDVGFYVTAANGAVKQAGGVSGPASATNNAFVRWDGVSGTSIKDTSDITYDGTTLVVNTDKFTVASSTGNTLVGGTLNVSGVPTIPTAAVGTKTTQAASTAFVSAFAQPISSSLGADVALSNTGLFFDGPSIAQGSSGTWFASGSIVVKSGAVANSFTVKLWDGTTVINAGVFDFLLGAQQAMVSLSGYLASPAGNLRISVKDNTGTDGKIIFNASGTSKDSTITAFKVAN